MPSLRQGDHLGRYEILAPLGAGGMGEVYRARDTDLDRDVAVKILPESFATDRDRLRRFEDEARAASALNHPNIMVIHDIGVHDGSPYIVTELLEGETLRDRMKQGGLSVTKAIHYGTEVARGLAAVHAKGITHRDLKPENLFVTNDGRVKILDFGLAKVTRPTAGNGDDRSSAPTEAIGTQPGTVMGTVGYMSPEQVRGEPSDSRSDIFSLGVVVHEMLSGHAPFQRDTTAETIAAILKEEAPELGELDRLLPVGFDRIVNHCLEKKAEDRFQSARDLAFALDSSGRPSGISSLPDAGIEPRGARSVRPVLTVAAVAVALAAAFFGGTLVGWNEVVAERPVFRSFEHPRGDIRSAFFAPGGKTVIFGATVGDGSVELFSARTDNRIARRLHVEADILGISDQGDMALLLGRRNLGNWVSKGTLALMPVEGGSPREVMEEVYEGDISPDGESLAVVLRQGSMHRLEYPIGEVLFETPGWISHPRIAPDGRRIAFLDHPIFGDDRGYVATVDGDGKVARVTGEWNAMRGLAWSPDGCEILFNASVSGSDYHLHAVEPGGSIRQVLNAPISSTIHDIQPDGAALLSAWWSLSSIGGYLPSSEGVNVLTALPEGASLGGLSADGTSFITVNFKEENYGAYLRSSDGALPVRLGDGMAVGISPDGSIVVSVRPGESFNSIVLYPTGAGTAEPVDLGGIRYQGGGRRTSFSADGRFMAFVGSEPGRGLAGYVFDFNDRSARAVTSEGVDRVLIAPDGHRLLVMNQDRQWFIQPLSEAQPVSVTGIGQTEIAIQWEDAGRSVFVWDQAFPIKIYRVDVHTGHRELWREADVAAPEGLLYGWIFMTPDGQHYLYRVRYRFGALYLVEGLH